MTDTRSTPASGDATIVVARVFPRLYRDSVALMAVAAQTERTPGVERVGAVMATPANLEILERSGMLPDGLSAASDDLIVVVRAIDETTATSSLDAAAHALTSAEQSSSTHDEPKPATIKEGLAIEPAATFVSVSTAGTYAPAVVEQALRSGLHVFCFSDNVAVEDEVRLKRMAVERGLLLMGPDCGTAVIDGVPFGFTNEVRRGPVSIISASGTGAQEVASLLHVAGTGVAQLIGLGGRDLSEQVGGLMAHHALSLVAADPETEVIVLVSKPPAPSVADGLLAALAASGKPVVACLLGLEDSDGPVIVRGTLEGGAIAAARLAGVTLDIPADPAPPSHAASAMGGTVRGLFAGGTLAAEAKLVLARAGVTYEVLDLGDDEYTAGRPHPMIDPTLRADEVARTGSMPEVGVVLVDLVIGHGANAAPAQPLADAARRAIESAAADHRMLVVVGSVCGTDADPQGLATQRRILEDAGIHVAPSAAAAARHAASIIHARSAAGEMASIGSGESQ